MLFSLLALTDTSEDFLAKAIHISKQASRDEWLLGSKREDHDSDFGEQELANEVVRVRVSGKKTATFRDNLLNSLSMSPN